MADRFDHLVRMTFYRVGQFLWDIASECMDISARANRRLCDRLRKRYEERAPF